MAMVKIKVAEAGPKALDWLVAKCLGVSCTARPKTFLLKWGLGELRYSTDWSQGGPIIGQQGISLDQFKGHPCRAYLGTPVAFEHSMFAPEGQPLIAAMRCHVASNLGPEVEVPEEVL